jgi:hypothetical protein
MTWEGRRVFASAGADPGPTTGLLLAAWDLDTGELLECLACECTASMAPKMLALMLSSPWGLLVTSGGMEAFVPRGRSQSLRGVSVRAVSDEITALDREAAAHGVRLTQRSAGLVKPWATDKRLAAAGLTEATEKFTDARDAGRHALFDACQRGMPDPLSQARAAEMARQEGSTMKTKRDARARSG